MTGIGIITTVAIKIVMIIEAVTGPTRKIRVGVMTIEIMIGTIIAAHIGTILPDVIQVMRVIVMIVASIEIAGSNVFLGDCENRLVLVKIYEAPSELPNTVVIGRLSHYGQVLSFHRDKIAKFIENGVRTARFRLSQHIPSIINLAGEYVRVWYPNQPKTCRNCGAEDHLVKDCKSIRCFNCEKPGHRLEDCEEPSMCTVCKSDEHRQAGCPFVAYSANVDSGIKEELSEEEKQKEKENYRAKME